jgi:hypothetical protein
LLLLNWTSYVGIEFEKMVQKNIALKALFFCKFTQVYNWFSFAKGQLGGYS